MRFRRVTFNPLSIMIGFHYGRNPVSGQRFLHIGLVPMVGLDFEFKPYINDHYDEIDRAMGDEWPGRVDQADL